MYAVAPTALANARLSGSSRAVSMTTRTSLVPPELRSSRQTTNPSRALPSNMTSSRTISGCSRRATASVSSGLVASSTRQPCAMSVTRTSARTARSSSATRTVGTRSAAGAPSSLTVRLLGFGRPSVKHDFSGDARIAASGGSARATQPWVEDITQTVSEEVERPHREQDREAGEQREPRLGADEVPSFADHHAPFGRRRLRAESDEAQPRGRDDRRAHVEARLDEQRRDRVGQQVTRQNPRRRSTDASSRLDVLAPSQR